MASGFDASLQKHDSAFCPECPTHRITNDTLNGVRNRKVQNGKEECSEENFDRWWEIID